MCELMFHFLHADNEGRYAYIYYDQQPRVCRWNLGKLAEALSPLLSEEDTLLALQLYDSEFEKSYLKKMRLKLGLCKEEEDDSDLIESLLDTMHTTGCDFTNGFQCLSRVTIPESQDSTEREIEGVVEYLLEECASPQQLVQSNRPKMPPQSSAAHVPAADGDGARGAAGSGSET
ncbi:Protein adenylyltransferase SelO, mitochondrial [Geodia barretti]|uniref:Selenoprotein O n=1 Tax=Geodia barretti TaxID=519541 RepID=A0AA35WKB5_GEOBA|nr:Protein adenylyltransferase SelO, mitochondrial [Geodia barretti]